MQQKIDLFSRAYGLLNPIGWKEPFGMVIIEAMAVGCPVISFAQGSIPELVSHGTSGFLVDDMDEMSHYVEKIGSLDRKSIRAYAEQNFSVEVMAERYTRVYHRVITTSLLKAPTTRVSPQSALPHVRKAPPTAPTPIAFPTPSPFVPSQKSFKSKASPFVRSEVPTEPDVESLSKRLFE
jgi:hypothetical protein